MEAAVAAFAVIFVAELGDKSQLIAFTFGARYPARWVVLGLLAANLVVQGLFSLVGGAVGVLIQGSLVGLGAGVLFFGFAVWALLDRDDDDVDDSAGEAVVRGGLRIAATVAGALFLAEIGDKTMFATVALAAREGVLPVWLGSFLGMSSAGILGVFAGRVIGERIPERALRVASALLFAAVGVWLVWDALAGM